MIGSVTSRPIVKLTTSFERNLEELESFLLEAGAPYAFDALLDELTDTVIPNVERFPAMGRLFLQHPVRSVEVANGIDHLTRQLLALDKEGELRDYATTHYLLLYARIDTTIYLLLIRHHRQLSFDIQGLWGI